MANLDGLVNKSFSVDSQYFGVNVLSGNYSQASFAAPYALTSLTAQALNDAGVGGVRGIGEQLNILAVNDAANTITYDVSVPGFTSPTQLTGYVLGYDATSNSLIFDGALTAQQVAGTLYAASLGSGSVSDLNIDTSILSLGSLTPPTTITYAALTAGTTVGGGSSGSPGTGTGSSPGQSSGGAVYRFFDTTYGTHLFTQSLSEAQNIVATRPDLTQETNTFGAVSSSSSGAEAIYRFFETTNGTHFFTSNYNEYLGLVTPGTATYRADLTYEASSTFYEDSTQQAGDVPVYRLFDRNSGTQFLTGSQTEYQVITTPGSSGYRPNYTSEGIAFYAPSGTFHT